MTAFTRRKSNRRGLAAAEWFVILGGLTCVLMFAVVPAVNTLREHMNTTAEGFEDQSKWDQQYSSYGGNGKENGHTKSNSSGNNGVGNGEDGQPSGNPPENDGPGTGPGNPGNKGGSKK